MTGIRTNRNTIPLKEDTHSHPWWSVESAMKPSRELDALIAEKVIGTRPFESEHDGWLEYASGVRRMANYSTDISAAWEVVEKFDGYTVTKDKNYFDNSIQYGSRIEHKDRYYCCEMEGESAPHAICLAALKSVGHEFN